MNINKSKLEKKKGPAKQKNFLIRRKEKRIQEKKKIQGINKKVKKKLRVKVYMAGEKWPRMFL